MGKKKELALAVLFGAAAGAGAMYGSTKMKKNKKIDKNEKVLVKEIEEELSEETESLGNDLEETVNKLFDENEEVK